MLYLMDFLMRERGHSHRNARDMIAPFTNPRIGPEGVTWAVNAIRKTAPDILNHNPALRRILEHQAPLFFTR